MHFPTVAQMEPTVTQADYDRQAAGSELWFAVHLFAGVGSVVPWAIWFAGFDPVAIGLGLLAVGTAGNAVGSAWVNWRRSRAVLRLVSSPLFWRARAACERINSGQGRPGSAAAGTPRVQR